MSITVPYTVILQSVVTGSVSTMLMEASPNTPAAGARRDSRVAAKDVWVGVCVIGDESGWGVS